MARPHTAHRTRSKAISSGSGDLEQKEGIGRSDEGIESFDIRRKEGITVESQGD
jgi:hypothetical protein